MGSEPKMPELPESLCEHLDAYFAAWGKTACDKLHDEIQAYAAGIRAAVLAEVRAVVPAVYGSNREDSYQDGIKDGRADAYNRIRDALATLENPNE